MSEATWALAEAAFRGDVEGMRALVESGVAVNTRYNPPERGALSSTLLNKVRRIAQLCVRYMSPISSITVFFLPVVKL